MLSTSSSYGPGTFDALSEFLDDRSEAWLTAPSRSHLIQALSLATTMSLRPSKPNPMASPNSKNIQQLNQIEW